MWMGFVDFKVTSRQFHQKPLRWALLLSSRSGCSSWTPEETRFQFKNLSIKLHTVYFSHNSNGSILIIWLPRFRRDPDNGIMESCFQMLTFKFIWEHYLYRKKKQSFLMTSKFLQRDLDKHTWNGIGWSNTDTMT